MVDDTGTVIPLHKMTREQAHAIAGVKFKTRTYLIDDEEIIEEAIEYKLTDRQKAKDMLAKYYGLYEKDNEQKAPDVPNRLVAYPLGDLTLEEWQAQAVLIMAGTRRGSKARPWPCRIRLRPQGASTVK